MPAIQVTKENATIRVIPTFEHETPYDSYFAMPKWKEDPKAQLEAQRFADDVQEMIDKHGLWGWCVVEVRATFGPFSGSAYLGACSYADEEDFKVGGYYEQMREEALKELQTNIDEAYALIAA